jgi:hypothetical protein
MTRREYLDIFKDLDRYIANGGRLMDLEILPPHAITARELGQETSMRLGRFYGVVGQKVKDRMVGDVLSEGELRAIWREAA